MHKEQFDELSKYGRQLDYNMKRFSDTRDDIIRVQGLLQFLIHASQDELRVAVNRLSDRFNLLEQQLVKHGLPKIDYYDHEFTTIRKMIESADWPAAVEEITRDEAYETAKANSILDLIVIDPLTNKKVLDFGCGNGYLSRAINGRGAALTVGYDPNGPESKAGNLSLTKDRIVVANNAPYDYIILFDVLDHCEDPAGTLKSIEALATPQTKIVVRNHPFSSRHGKHLFTTINKAFIHMILDDMELVRLCGDSGHFTQPVLRPIKEYRLWIAGTDFEVVHEGAVTTEIESYFTSPDNYLLRDKIMQKYEGEDPAQYMSIDFVDYQLRKKRHVVI